MPDLHVVTALHDAIINNQVLPKPLRECDLADFLYPLSYIDPDGSNLTMPHNAFSVAIASANMIILDIISRFEEEKDNQSITHDGITLTPKRWLVKEFSEKPFFQLAADAGYSPDPKINDHQLSILKILLAVAERLKIDLKSILNQGHDERFFRYTPLYYAALNLNPDLVAVLLKHGSDYHARSGNFKTRLAYLSPIETLEEKANPSVEDYKNAGKCLQLFAKAMQPDNLHHDKEPFSEMKARIIAFLRKQYQTVRSKSAEEQPAALEKVKVLHESMYPILAIHRDRRQTVVTVFRETIGAKPSEPDSAKEARKLLEGLERELNEAENARSSSFTSSLQK